MTEKSSLLGWGAAGVIGIILAAACQEEQPQATTEAHTFSADYEDRKEVFARLLKDTGELGADPNANPKETFSCFKDKFAADDIDPGVILAMVASFYEVLDEPENLTQEARTNMANAVVMSQKYIRACAPASQL